MYLKFLCRTLERRGHLFGALQIRVLSLILDQNYWRTKTASTFTNGCHQLWTGKSYKVVA